MKNKWKSISLAAVLILILASSVSVLAEDRQGASGWKVTFDSKKMESNFTSADMSNRSEERRVGKECS